MPTPDATIARRAAARLTDLDPRLQKEVARLLLAAATGAPPPRFLDAGLALSAAALLVSAAQFGWQIWWDLRCDSDRAPAPEAVTRRIRVRLDERTDLPPLPAAARDRIIEVVVEEVAAAAEPPAP